MLFWWKILLICACRWGQPAVEKALGNFHAEIERDMKLMGCSKVSDLNRDNLRYREKTKYI